MHEITCRGKVVAGKAKLLRHPLPQVLGLMFSRPRNLIFALNRPKKVRMHMLFVFFPIDVVFLNLEKEVIEIKENFRPFSVYLAKNKAKYILELGKGAIDRAGIRLGDTLSF